MPYYNNFWDKDAHENIPPAACVIFFCKIENWEPAYRIWRGIDQAIVIWAMASLP